MGLFAPPEVKALKEKALHIGGLIGGAYTGINPPALIDELLAEDGWERTEFRAAFEAAAQKVGRDKALSVAIRDARWAAGYAAELANMVRRPAWEAAEQAIGDLLS